VKVKDRVRPSGRLKQATDSLLRRCRPSSPDSRNPVGYPVHHHPHDHRGWGRFAPGYIGELTQLVPFEMVDEALAGRCSLGLRDLPSRVVVYLLWPPVCSQRWDIWEVWRKLAATLADIPTVTLPSAGWRKPRRQIGVAPLRWLS
jgi:hypothetical protein